jgi:voltage-gated potassium channel
MTPSRPLARPVIFTAALVGLVASSALEFGDWPFVVVLLVSIGCAVAFLQVVFPGSRFFVVALANGLAVYTCVFVVFVEANFAVVGRRALEIGFALPIAAFLAGAWFRREHIRTIVVDGELQWRPHTARPLAWLLPVGAVGALTLLVPDATASTAVFLGAVTAIAGIVFWLSADIAEFLVEAGLLFEGFFQRMRRLLVPAFAFMTFYSIIVIVFAAVYRLLDRMDGGVDFVVGGTQRSMSFAESLYFSLVTMATVGYGDIVPVTGAARVIASIQMVLGLLLLLFGFTELMEYARERRERQARPEG